MRIWLGAAVLMVAVACSSPLGPEPVAVGTWGGDHASLAVTSSGGHIEYDCAHGELTEPLILDRSGRFQVSGTHTPEHGGPIRVGEKEQSRPARYDGQVDGDRMTLSVTLTDTGEPLGTFTLTHGVSGHLVKCV